MPLDRKTVIRVLMTERDRLYAYIWSLIGDVHLAEDVLQEVSLLAADKADEVSNEQALAPYDPVNAGADLILFDSGTLSGTFGTVNIINGTGTLDYAYDQGRGDLAIALTHVIPTPAALPAGPALIAPLPPRPRR